MSSEINKTYWEVSFDLDTEKLKLVYRKTPTYAYAEIKKHFFSNGFDNKDDKQGSCYFSNEKMKLPKVQRIIISMTKELPWFSECVSKIAIAEKRDDTYNLMKTMTRINKSVKHKEALAEYHKKIEAKRKRKSR